jgi:hypothetical protein
MKVPFFSRLDMTATRHEELRLGFERVKAVPAAKKPNVAFVLAPSGGFTGSYRHFTNRIDCVLHRTHLFPLFVASVPFDGSFREGGRLALASLARFQTGLLPGAAAACGANVLPD